MLRRELTGFLVAGSLGFLTDTCVLYLLQMASVGPYVGRVVSFLCAVYVTWHLNRKLAFTGAGNNGTFWEWWRYLWAMSAGGLINFAAYSATLHLAPETGWRPLLGVTIGSAIALFANFLIMKFWVFRKRSYKP